MKKLILTVLIALGAQLVSPADSWSDMLRAYKLDLSTLVRGNGYQFFRSEAGGIGIAWSEMDSSGNCHFSLAMTPVEARLMRWLPRAGAGFAEVQDYGYTSGVLALREVKGPDTDPKLGSFSYVIEPKILVGPDGRILNLGYSGDKLIFLVERSSGVFWAGEDGQKVDIPTAEPPSKPSAQPILIADTRAVDLGLSVFWADRNVGADTPEGFGDYLPFGTKVPWGSTWRTPTRKELEDLLNKCSWEFSTSSGVAGYKVTGPNGNSIFLPLGGDLSDDGTLDRPGTIGAILSSERPEGQYFIDNNYFYHLQMTTSDSEQYRHYLRFYNFGDRHNLRPVMPKP
ncbi:MAG: hypothetical protein IJV01_03255 [Bacteroidales bacterium]|nr:hypothetical protein [Bacteroidales bacterium]